MLEAMIITKVLRSKLNCLKNQSKWLELIMKMLVWQRRSRLCTTERNHSENQTSQLKACT